jgi:hypothetical protein
VSEEEGEASLLLGSILLRKDRMGIASTDVPAFFSDLESIAVYSGNTSYYKVKQQPRLLLLNPQTIMDLYERAKTKEDQLTIHAYMNPPINEKTVYSVEFNEKDAIVQPTGFLSRKDLDEYKTNGHGLYINRRMANLVCKLGYDGWLVMPGALYQYVPSRNAVVPYAPEIMLCAWNNILELMH